jgi:hypothetical protein
MKGRNGEELKSAAAGTRQVDQDWFGLDWSGVGWQLGSGTWRERERDLTTNNNVTFKVRKRWLKNEEDYKEGIPLELEDEE